MPDSRDLPAPPSGLPEVPADLPPEYAEAYRRGYQRAYESGFTPRHLLSDDDPDEEVVPAPREEQPGGQVASPSPPETTHRDALAETAPLDAGELAAARESAGFEPVTHPEQAVRISALEELFATDTEERVVEEERADDPSTQPRWLMPALTGALVLALLLGAYGVGRLFSDDGDEQQPAASLTSPGAAVTQPKPSAATDPTQSPSKQSPAKQQGEAWQGAVVPVQGVRAEVGCVLPPSRDAAGNRIDYRPARMVDGDYSTAWRCAGNGRGVTIRLAFDEKVALVEVGLVAGYAKTDPRTSADRYAENNRITRVRWTLPDGTSFEQALDGKVSHRDPQTMRIPVTKLDSLELELLSSVRGPRNTVAISELALSAADQ